MDFSIKVHRASERGRSQFGWLDSRHTFSFGRYHDSNHMGFGPLRVLNEDRINAGEGFDTHPHKNLEILSYVIEGELRHKDSAGHEQIVRAGDVQVMSAGTGIEHSEFNNSRREAVHFLQIWVLPKTDGLTPSYQQRAFPDELKKGSLCLIASMDGRNDSLTIHQDVSVYSALLEKGDHVVHPADNSRRFWVQMIRGEVSINQTHLSAGDGAGMEGADQISIRAIRQSELLLFDML